MRNVGVAMLNFVTTNNTFPASGRWDIPNVAPGAGGGDLIFNTIQGYTLGDPANASAVTVDNYRVTMAATGGGTIAPYGMRYSWVRDLLPYLDRSDIFDQWDVSDEGDNGSYLDNFTATAGKRPAATNGSVEGLSDAELKVMACPADPSVQGGRGNLSYVVNGGFAPHWALSAAIGSNATAIPAVASSINNTFSRDNMFNMGLMFLESGVIDATGRPANSPTRRRHTLDTIKDGRTTTIMLSENVNAGFSENVNYGASSVSVVNWACPHPYNTSFFVRAFTPGVTTACITDNPPVPATLYDYSIANEKSSTGGGINGDITGLSEGISPYPTSLHPGGVNVVMCDGSARFIADAIAGDVWARLVTPNGSKLGGPGVNANGRPLLFYEDTTPNRGNAQKQLNEREL
jgi:prepilin-type processing-associated H-X9-DG protein